MERTSEDTILIAAFPTQQAPMRALRRLDSEFDEICSDFVELTRIASKSEPSRDLDGIIESLTDLKQGIKSTLERSEKSKSSKERHTQ